MKILTSYKDFELKYQKECKYKKTGHVVALNGNGIDYYYGFLCKKNITIFEDEDNVCNESHICNLKNCPDCDDIDNYNILYSNIKSNIRLCESKYQ